MRIFLVRLQDECYPETPQELFLSVLFAKDWTSEYSGNSTKAGKSPFYRAESAQQKDPPKHRPKTQASLSGLAAVNRQGPRGG